MRGLGWLNRVLAPLQLRLVAASGRECRAAATRIDGVIRGTPADDPTKLSVLVDDLAAIVPVRRYERILEVGPKFGDHSRYLATLDPRELVLLDLAREVDHGYVAALPCPTRLVFDNLLTTTDVAGPFDLIVCLGVLYHNVEPFRLLARLWDLAAPDAVLILETTLTSLERRLDGADAVFEVRWRPGREGNYLLPSRCAVWTALAMTGWTDIRWYAAFRSIENAMLLTCRRAADRPSSHLGAPFGIP